MDINESPAHVLLNPLVNHAQKNLPVTIYESGIWVAYLLSVIYLTFNNTKVIKFMSLWVYNIVIQELHVIDGIPQFIFVHSSYTIETVEAEWISVDQAAHLEPSDGGSVATQCDIPCENSLLRQVSSLLRRLPVVESGKFQDDFLMECNDTLFITYLAMLTNCSSSMNELVDKFNTEYDRHSRRGGRGAFM